MEHPWYDLLAWGLIAVSIVLYVLDVSGYSFPLVVGGGMLFLRFLGRHG